MNPGDLLYVRHNAVIFLDITNNVVRELEKGQLLLFISNEHKMVIKLFLHLEWEIFLLLIQIKSINLIKFLKSCLYIKLNLSFFLEVLFPLKDQFQG